MERGARGALGDSLAAGLAALVVGLLIHGLTVWARDYGPSWDGVSLRGNGALVFLLPVPLALVVGEVWCARRRAWLGMALVPLALYAGLFVLGPI
jgi:hypothetical protein